MGISHKHLGDVLLRREQPKSWPGEAPWFRLALLGGPPALFAIVAFLTRGARLARRDPDAARARRAYAMFAKRVRALRGRQALAPREVTDALVKAVNDYVADRFGLCRGAASDQEMARLLARRRVDAAAARRLELFCDHTASMQFSQRGSNGAATGDVVREIPDAIEKIERSFAGG